MQKTKYKGKFSKKSYLSQNIISRFHSQVDLPGETELMEQINHKHFLRLKLRQIVQKMTEDGILIGVRDGLRSII